MLQPFPNLKHFCGWSVEGFMGKAMKVKKKLKGKSPGKGPGPEKGSPEKGTPKSMKVLKRPATLALNRNDPGLSLEEKMDQFAKKTNGNTQEFLDNLSAPQRECLWGRFARARKALGNNHLDSLWDKHCKGEGSDQHKKKLLAIYLKSRGDLKKGNAYAKELVGISETTGILVAFGIGLGSLAFSLLITTEASRRHQNGCHLLSSLQGLA